MRFQTQTGTPAPPPLLLPPPGPSASSRGSGRVAMAMLKGSTQDGSAEVLAAMCSMMLLYLETSNNFFSAARGQVSTTYVGWHGV